MLRLAALALSVSAALAACTPAVQPGETPAPAARRAVTVSMQITDPSQIFSDYDLRGDTAAAAAAHAQGVSETQWADIVRLANESEWPTGLRDVASRVRLRDEIRRLHATRIATFRDKVILYVPSAQPGLPAAVQGRAFYLVVAERGVTMVR